MGTERIASSMLERGYEPLSVGRHASIGFRKNLKRASIPLEEPIWFDTGCRMRALDEDGNPTIITRTVCAHTEEDVEEFKKKGWKPVERG